MKTIPRWVPAGAALVLLLGLGWVATSLAQPARAAAAPVSSNVHIFYYSWYGNPSVAGSYRHWPQGGHTPPQDIGANYYPVRGAYDSGDFAGAVNQHMAWIS